MNERIQQLAEQAGLSEGVFTRHDGVPCDLKGYSMLPDEMQKFAQLIVRECISVMKSTVDESIDFERELDETSSWIESDIKKHFGVEE